MNPDLTNISPDKHVNNVDVFGKTKQYKIRDSINSMDREKKDEGFTNNVFDQQDDKYEPNSQYILDEEEFNNIKFKESLISYNTEKTKDFRVKLDLSVPNLHKENIGMSGSREMSSIIRKTPDFFKRINTSEDLYDSKNTDDLRYQERYVNNEDISEMRHNRNRSLHNATLSQGPSSSFFYQNDLNNIYSEQSSHGDGFFQSHLSDNYNIQQDTNCQSNNLFGQSFPYLNKKRSYSEADLNKSNRNNPFLNFRRNSQYNDDFYNKSSRQMSDVCIDPRMFYKNIPNNHSQIKNKENHHKPAFSYAQIITRALNASQDGKLTLGEIYKWIEDNFEYYRYANPVWKNSIRHNLSLSKCFKKVAREPGTRGKGGKWMIDQEFIAQEEQRKKRKSFEAENLMNYHSYDINPEDPRFYQM